MEIERSTVLKLLGSLGLAGLLLLSMGLSLGLAQGPFTKTRVTVSSDGANRNSYNPSISANGTKVAFFSDSDFLGQGIPKGQFEIWLYDISNMTLTRVTTSSDGTNRYSFDPSLSADGTKVAFTSDSDFLGQGILDDQNEIWLFDTTTMTLTRVTTSSDGTNIFTNGPSLSPDGTKVAFHSNGDFLGKGISQDHLEIWLFNTTTMTVTRVTTSGSGRESAVPSLNEDGTKVAFESTADFLSQGIDQFQPEIWLYDFINMTLTRVTTSSDGPNRFSIESRLSADGTTVTFFSDSDFLGQGILQSQPQIWLYDTAAMTLTRVTTPNGYGGNNPSLNADGTKVAFESIADFLGQGIFQRAIWLYDTDTMTFTRVTTSSDGPNRESWLPSLNADGTKVAFVSDSDFLGQGIAQSQYEIWLFEDQSVIVDPPKTIYLPIILKN